MIQTTITIILVLGAVFYLLVKRGGKKKTKCGDKECSGCPLKKECGKKS